MNSKFKLKLLSLSLALFTVFSMTACSDDEASDGGEMEVVSEQSKDNTSGTNPSGDNSASESNPTTSGAKFTKEYYDWITLNAFSTQTGFVDAMNKTVFPENLETVFNSWGEKREKHYIDIFCPTKVKYAVQAANEFETNKTYNNFVSQVRKNKNWIYNMNMEVVSGNKCEYELMLSESKKALKLVEYDNDGNVMSLHEISETNDGYIAVNMAGFSNGKWSGYQLLFKSGEGYCIATESSDTEPASIYETSLPAGFAGK